LVWTFKEDWDLLGLWPWRSIKSFFVELSWRRYSFHLSCIFNIIKTEFRCYKHKQLYRLTGPSKEVLWAFIFHLI
jgi:hypothetical protein